MPRSRYPWRSILGVALVVGIGTLVLDAPKQVPGSVTVARLPWEGPLQGAPKKVEAQPQASTPAGAPSAAAAAPAWTREPVKVDPTLDKLQRVSVEPRENPYPTIISIDRFVRTPDSTTLIQPQGTLKLAGLRPVPAKALCSRDDRSRFACGFRARNALQQMVAGKAIQCRAPISEGEASSIDCVLLGERVARRLVADGWAVPVDDRDSELVAALALAKSSSAGIWSSMESRNEVALEALLTPTTRLRQPGSKGRSQAF